MSHSSSSAPEDHHRTGASGRLKLERGLVGLVCGLLFAAGLARSGMTDPQNIHNFLNVFSSSFDPSLALVMASAILVAAPAYYLVRKKHRAILCSHVGLDNKGKVDKKLVTGAGLFGISWGLTGLCPGPGWVSAANGYTFAGIYIVFLLLGLWLSGRPGTK